MAVDAVTEKIAGFIALSKCSPKAKGILGKYPNTFEVHRVFVVPEFRSRGIAGHLMSAVEQVGLRVTAPGATATFVATTLNILDSANRFYVRRGYVLEETTELADVTLHHYVSHLSK